MPQVVDLAAVATPPPVPEEGAVLMEAMGKMNMQAPPATMPDEASAKHACLQIWEDSPQLLANDPMLRHMDRADPFGEVPRDEEWRHLYKHMMQSEKALFALDRQVGAPGTQQYNVQIKEPVLKLDDEYYPHPWEDASLVGCTNRYAIVTAAMQRKDPDVPLVYDLYRVPIADWQVAGESVMPRMGAEHKSASYDLEARIARELQNVHKQQPTPFYERIPSTKMKSKPLCVTLSIETGHCCIITAAEQDVLLMFQCHANRGDEVRLGRLELPAGLPDEVVCSSRFVALRYNASMGTLESTPESAPVELPPHIQVYPMFKATVDCATIKELEQQRLIKPGVFVHPSSEADHYWSMSKLEFHDNQPQTLYACLRNEGAVPLEAVFFPEEQCIRVRQTAEVMYFSLSAAQLLEMHRQDPKTVPVEVLQAETKSEYRSLRVRAVGERGDETRILALSRGHLSTVSGDPETQGNQKRASGKVPVTYMTLNAPCVSVHNCGNMMVIHEAHNNGVMLCDFATGKQMLPFVPSGNRDNTMELPPCEQLGIQTTRAFSNRVVVLLPMGYLFFVQQNDKTFEKRYQAVRAQVIKAAVEERQKVNAKAKEEQAAKDALAARAAAALNIQSGIQEDEENVEELEAVPKSALVN
jgi:hypothetical protein